jgi:hypothetical protein
MKTIEESHPSLKLKEVNISFDIESFDERWRTEEHITKSLIRSEDVQEHTIDKAVLKEVLKRKKRVWCDEGTMCLGLMESIEKELGLEEE